ncbi:Speckle-type POZ protein B [Orchesella cincta]|uniref:Speckle-type POZ protein B n=1 Tax=Orchesella cincta TaxID=48709 RepID=A0A1D2MD10_ORCCI|nr:Speckle-type POZ protein B [Orchesella cincta]
MLCAQLHTTSSKFHQNTWSIDFRIVSRHAKFTLVKMETKILRFEGVPGRIENQYVMTVQVPGKFDLLNMIERPPFHIFSKHDTTYTTGILACVPHSVKLRISRDYQEPFVGVYIKLTPKSDEIVEISEVKGTFSVCLSPSENPKLPQRDTSRSPPACPSMDVRASFHNNNNIYYHQNEIIGKDGTRIFPFSFFKNSVSKLPELESYEYYESRCHWPDVASIMELQIKITKTTYSVLVSDESNSMESSEEPRSKISSTPYFLSDAFSDVTIKVGEENFPAHKIILSERSKFFSRMFANSMRENNEGIVRIPGDDEALFREVLRFIYQGTVENLDENASELYILSDKYDIPELSALCEKHLLDHLNVENAVEMFDISQTVASQGLLAKKSKELIMWNKDKFVSDLKTFKDFSRKYPEVVFELLQLIFTCRSTHRVILRKEAHVPCKYNNVDADKNWESPEIDELCYSVSLKVPCKNELLNLLPSHLDKLEYGVKFHTGILAAVEHSIIVCLFREYHEPKIGLFIRKTILRTIRARHSATPKIVNEDEDTFPQTDFSDGQIQIGEYFMNDECSDIIILCQSSTKFPAHRIVLSTRVEYFKSMLASRMKETVEGIIRIDDMDPVTCKEFLRFIYQGKVENLSNSVRELYTAADKYGMDDLRSLCERHLFNHLTVENALEVYDLSQMHGSPVLSRRSKEIIIWNRDRFASDPETFKNFTCKYPELIFHLFKAII